MVYGADCGICADNIVIMQLSPSCVCHPHAGNVLMQLSSPYGRHVPTMASTSARERRMGLEAPYWGYCRHTHTHTHTHTNTHIRTRTHTYAHAHTHTCTHEYGRNNTCTHWCKHTLPYWKLWYRSSSTMQHTMQLLTCYLRHGERHGARLTRGSHMGHLTGNMLQKQ